MLPGCLIRSQFENLPHPIYELKIDVIKYYRFTESLRPDNIGVNKLLKNVNCRDVEELFDNQLSLNLF